MIQLVTYCDQTMTLAAALCEESGKLYGGADSACRFMPDEDSPVLQTRGLGYWAWKPAIIERVMNGDKSFLKPLNDGDVLIYSDAGVQFLNNVRYIIDRMDQDIFLFGNHWEHEHWCKRDIIKEIWPEGHFGKQCQASVIFVRVSPASRDFVANWRHWCEFDGGRLIDDSPSRTPNHPEFQENRHDQAILTTLAYREGIKLHYWPARYEGGFDYPKHEQYQTDDYPILFYHHRLRNHEWARMVA